MAKELAFIDVSKVPELLEIAREVSQTGESRLLKSGGEVLAMVAPIGAPTKRTAGRRKTGVITDDDPLWNIVGIAKTDGATDVSGNKQSYLAEAYAAEAK